MELSELPLSGVKIAHKPSSARLEFISEPTLAGTQPLSIRLAHYLNGRGPRRWTINTNLPHAPTTRRVRHSWSEVIEDVGGWAKDLADDLSVPDLWDSLESASRMNDSLHGAENSAFTKEEQDVIAERLNALKVDAKTTYGLSDEQAHQLEAKLDYLLAASKRVGRLDWRNVVAGTLLGMISEAILPTRTTHMVFAQLLSSVGHVLGHPLPQLGS